jgi:hypothetical protein
MAAFDLARRCYNVTIATNDSVLLEDFQAREEDFENITVPNLYQSIPFNAYQFQELLKSVKIPTQMFTYRHMAYQTGPGVFTQTDVKSSFFFYSSLMKSMTWSGCMGLWTWTKNIMRTHQLSGLSMKTLAKKYSHQSFEEFMKNDNVDYKKCMLYPFLVGTGLNASEINAADALARMIYYVTSTRMAVRTYYYKANKQSNLAIGEVIVQALEDMPNVRIKYECNIENFRTDSHGHILGDLTSQEKFDHVIMAGDTEQTIRVLNNTKYGNSGEPSIYEPLHKALKNLVNVSDPQRIRVILAFLSGQKKFPTKEIETVVIENSNFYTVTQLHLVDDNLRQWAKENKGSVLQVVTDLKEEEIFLSNLAGNTSVRIYDTSTDQDRSVSQFDARAPSVNYMIDLGLKNLYLATTWTRTSAGGMNYPAQGTERLLSLGREAANSILGKDGLRQWDMYVAKPNGAGYI